MLRDVYWRQYPIDLLSDDNMACVEALLPDDQKHIPYMVYIAALKLCDDNGVFDIDDGVVLARLTRVKDVRTVLDVVNLMRQRKILYRLFDGSSLCGLVDWTYADKKSRTIDERRRLVAERIEKEQARAGIDKDFTLPGMQAAPMTAPKEPAAPETETAPAADASLCAENDKNAKNVVISGMDDKNAENVVKTQYSTVQDNTLHNTVQKDIQTNTHTQQQAPGYGPLEGPPPEACQDTNAVGVKIQNDNTKNSDTLTGGNAYCGDDVTTLAEEALREAARKDVEDTGQASLIGYLNEFFVKNCYGFKKNQSVNAMNTLAGKILELSDDVNPPGTVASVLCSEFKKMCEGQRGKHWKDMPLLPARMINANVWAVLVQHAGKILATSKNQELFIQAAKKAEAECEADKGLVYDAIREEYVKYNIDPEDPNAQKLLLMAKSREAEAKRAEDEDFEIF